MTITRQFKHNSTTASRGGFTLMELLMVLLIITIIAGMSIAALAGATEVAREARTRSMISKLDQLIMDKYESYHTRAVPVKIPPQTDPRSAAQLRLVGLRELMRMEMPDRISDICTASEIADLTSDGNLNNFDSMSFVKRSQMSAVSALSSTAYASQYILRAAPSVALSYRRQVARSLVKNGPWTGEHQHAECLYLIISSMRDGDRSSLDFFSEGEIGDTDGDGMKEFLDGWGSPIGFWRWAPGYVQQIGTDGIWGVSGNDFDRSGTANDLGDAGEPGSDDILPLTTQTLDYTKAPDAFDPLRIDPRWSTSTRVWYPYALLPLIVSRGRDKEVGIGIATTACADMTIPSDPYFTNTTRVFPDSGSYLSGMEHTNADNITNHFQETP